MRLINYPVSEDEEENDDEQEEFFLIFAKVQNKVYPIMVTKEFLNDNQPSCKNQSLTPINRHAEMTSHGH